MIGALMGILLVLVVLFLFLSIFLIPIFILHYCKKYLTRKGFHQVKYIYRALVMLYVLFLIHSTYYAVYPKDDFYISEFEREIKVGFSEDGKILSKYADYPDFHGDYSSYFIAELKPEEYHKLLHDLDKSSEFVKLDSVKYDWDMEAGGDSTIVIEKEKISSSYIHEYNDDRTTLSFCKDGVTILFACHKL